MSKEEREWILNNVEEICIDTKDVDEISMGLEHLSVFSSETIKNLATTVLDLQSQLDIANKKLDEIKEYADDKREEFNEVIRYYLDDNLIGNEDEVNKLREFRSWFMEILSIIGGE